MLSISFLPVEVEFAGELLTCRPAVNSLPMPAVFVEGAFINLQEGADRGVKQWCYLGSNYRRRKNAIRFYINHSCHSHRTCLCMHKRINCTWLFELSD